MPTSGTPWAASRSRVGAPASRQRPGRPGERGLWHERDISHSSVERVIIPTASWPRPHVAPLHRHRERPPCRSGTDEAKPRLDPGLVFSGQLLLELTATACAARTLSHRPEPCHGGLADGERLPAAGVGRSEIRAVMSGAALDEVFNLDRYLGHVDAIFRRVFPDEPPPALSRTSLQWPRPA